MLFEQVMIKMFFLKPFLQRVSLNFGVVGYIILPMGQLVVGKMWLTQEFFAFNTKQKKNKYSTYIKFSCNYSKS